jgi:hypothetical protein
MRRSAPELPDDFDGGVVVGGDGLWCGPVLAVRGESRVALLKSIDAENVSA